MEHYQTPLKEKVENMNTGTVLLDEKRRPLIRTAGLPAKAPWLKAIWAGNYEMWPLVTARIVNNYFPESNETQKRHVEQVPQGVIKDNGMTYELVPQDMHQRNIAEKAIQTVNDNLVAILSRADALFPMHLWDRLLPQAELKLNLLIQ
ncbi:hypothetical protein ACHAW6_012898 [Cyclotella cf. meneghiniana]